MVQLRRTVRSIYLRAMTLSSKLQQGLSLTEAVRFSLRTTPRTRPEAPAQLRQRWTVGASGSKADPVF
jgi:hypothetical protein